MPLSRWTASDDPFGPILLVSTFDSWEEVKKLLTDDKAVGPTERRVWRIRIVRITPEDAPIAMTKMELFNRLKR